MVVANYNTNNPWLSMFQQGLGRFGINTNGYGSFGSMGIMGINGSLFNYNVDYDAMAGFAVTNAVFGVANQAISTSRAEKQAEKNDYESSKNDIKNIDKRIADLNAEKSEPKIDAKYDKNITTAQTALENAKTSLDNANTKKAELETESQKADTTPERKAAIEKEINNLKIEEKQKEYDKLNGDAKTEGSVKYLEAQKEKAIADRKIAIDKEIKDLENEKKELQAKVDAYDLDKANGNKLSRTSDKKFDTYLENGVAKNNVDYSRADAKTATDRFMKALDDSPEKLQAAKNLVTIHNNCSNWNMTTKRAAEIAQAYIDEHEK